MNQPATTRLVPVERLSAITSLIAEGAVFDGNFHTTRDQGIKVDGQLKGNITFESGGTLHVGATGVIENTRLEADYVFIEANERPGLANHEPQPTAERFVDLLFPQSVPPAARLAADKETGCPS